MPYKRVEPVPLSEIRGMKKYWGKRHTICQMLREIYSLTDNEEIKMRCRLGMAMAKRMQEKLVEYKTKETTAGDVWQK